MYAFLVVFDFSLFLSGHFSFVFSLTLNVPLLRHHTLVGTRCWQSMTRVFVVFLLPFHMAAVQRRCGMVESLVQRYADSENWFVRWEEERRCEDGFLVTVPFGKIELMLPPWDAAGQISSFRSWQVQQQYSGRCSQWRGGPDDRRYWSAWEQWGWSRCVGHSSR